MPQQEQRGAVPPKNLKQKGRKKYSWPALIFALLMGVSRVYLVVHYPTDVLGGFLIGAVGAVAAYFIVGFFWRLFEAHRNNGFCRFVVTFDPVALCRRAFDKKAAAAAGEGEGQPATEETLQEAGEAHPAENAPQAENAAPPTGEAPAGEQGADEI